MRWAGHFASVAARQGITRGLAIRASGILVIFGLAAAALPGPTSARPPAAGPGADPPAAERAPDPGLALIEAVRLTLENDPAIAIVETRLDDSRGALLATRGVFDPVLASTVLQSETRTPLSETTSADGSSLSQTVSLDQLLRSGLVLTPAVDLQRTDDAGPASNVATVSFALRQPLLRDRGRVAVAAPELAGERELEAARLELEHAVAQRLATVVDRYWRTRAAALDLEVLRSTEASSRELLETTRRLVAADVTPAAEIVQLEADLTSREVSRIAGERALFRARQDLGLEIGLEPVAILALPLPGDPFPVVAATAVPAPESPALIAAAILRRADHAAARERVAAAEIRLRAAENATKPRLDLLLTPSYSGLAEGGGIGELYAPLIENVPGLSTTFGFSFSWPTRNRRAEGLLVQAEASARRSALQAELIAKTIGAEVPAALDAVRRGAEQLRRLDRAVSLFEETLSNEIKKLRAGSSTVVDVITQRDRLTSVRQRRVAAQLALALALVDLRFETGTLYAGDVDARSIGPESLITVPF